MTDSVRDPRDLALVGTRELTADTALRDLITMAVDAAPHDTCATSHLRDAVAAAAKRGQPLVCIGTSGSTDYLRDQIAGQRLWPGCDGLHDESAPVQYLCSRCFPDRGDLAEPQEDASDEARRDDDQEME